MHIVFEKNREITGCFNPLLPDSFRRLSGHSLRKAHRRRDAHRIILMIPSYLKIKILVKEDLCVQLGAKGSNKFINFHFLEPFTALILLFRRFSRHSLT